MDGLLFSNPPFFPLSLWRLVPVLHFLRLELPVGPAAPGFFFSPF